MKNRILSLLLAAIMLVGMLPVGAVAESTDAYAANLEKQAKFAYDLNISGDPASEEDWSAARIVPLSVVQDLIVVVKNYKIVAQRDEIWYEIEALDGETLPEAFAGMTWVFHDKIQDPMGATLVFRCDGCGEFGCTETHETCPACGKYACDTIHFYCQLCGKYDCGEAHLRCQACGEADCAETHIWCGLCAAYDCGETHENTAPDTVPVIPDAPAMTKGMAVSIVDENGYPVTEAGLLLREGTKRSLSAWSGLGENVLYQWQIRYDSEHDRWADIQGQKGKGILLAPAMILSILQVQGSAAIRCVVTAGDQTMVSEAIPVGVEAPTASAMGTSSVSDGAAPANEDEENKVNLIINYVFANGKIAANPWAASLPAGVAFETDAPITIPTIAGYTPALGEGTDSAKAMLDGYQLSLNFTAEDLKADRSVTVVYQPAPVKVVVEHYQQNVDNDNYTLLTTEELSLVTGSTVGDVHKQYAGFYSLLYEHPTVAADGSTVVQVYYDRYYYLMKFELDGGYGVDPIYARYGTPVQVATPTRAGYGFESWVDAEGDPITIPATMPENGGTYYAGWDPQGTRYAIAYWVMNEDGTKTYIGSEMRTAQAGSTVSGGNTLTTDTNVCAMLAHAHSDDCRSNCESGDHVHGDGNCVYDCGMQFHDHTSGCVCTQSAHATHTRSCYQFTTAQVNNNNSSIGGIGGYTLIGTNNGLSVYKSKYFDYYYVELGGQKYLIENYSTDLSLAHTMTCHTHSDACCNLGHDHADCVCTLHEHTEACYSCDMKVHTHTADCKTDLAKYVDFVQAQQNVTVKGDGSTVVNVYYEYRTYTIRFIYAKDANYGYQIASSTGNGTFGGCSWTYAGRTLPTFQDPSGKTERSTVTIGTDTYYYISLSAKYGADISAIWPSGNLGNAGSYEWGSWAAAAGTGYREKYGDAHANIVGPYPTMSADMIVENPEKLADGTYLAQNMIAWWGSNEKILPHAYHNYFELLPGETEVAGKVYATYGGKRYRLEETYVFTAAHNGTTRVDPIVYNGYVCVNDSRDTNNDTQANSNNYANNGNCSLCGDSCDYCNAFYYDRNEHSLYFWNYNGYLREGTGAQVLYGDNLAKYGAYVSDAFMGQPENYPDNLEAEAYQFAGWYTTSDCLDGTQMDWSATMPDADVTVYAKWVPVSRAVRFYLDRSDMDAQVTIPERMAALYAANHGGAADPDSPYVRFATNEHVPNKSYIADVTVPGVSEGYENHPYSGYTFVGWFYLENGREKAFDPANMPVNQNLRLYGKWSSNVLCPYEIHFALDANGDGIADTDSSGKTIFVADPITGSTLAGNARTFEAKGDTALYADYQTGYFPNISSHTLDLKAEDDNNDGKQDTATFTFLYTPSDPVPYTVKYLEKNTDKVLDTQEVRLDNTRAVVTENFKPISGYMPDSYQKTLVVVPGGENVIVFYYTKDIQHALYQVNHYIENLDGGWTEYHSATFTGEIGKDYFASAEAITGFTFSDALTERYNTADRINAYTGTALPGDVRFSAAADTVTGTLTGNGMQINLYYTRDTHTYQVQYLEFGTERVLHPQKTAQAKYNQLVTEHAAEITIDLDGDGKYEDFRLYEATKDPQTATIKDDSTVLKFYYVRCTQDLSLTKTVVDEDPNDSQMPDPEHSFRFLLTIHANDFHQASYPYEVKKDGKVVASGYKSVSDDGENWPALAFSLKDGETVTFLGLPTAEYTIEEQEIPLGYYETYAPGQDVKLTLNAKAELSVTNTFAPAVLEISKTVEKEESGNTPEKETFEFTVTVPAGVTGDLTYTVSGEEKTVAVTGGKMVIHLKNGQTARFDNLPLGDYTVTETGVSGYHSYVSVNGGTFAESLTAQVVLKRGTTNTVDYRNKFPEGDLNIQKTVSKAFYGTPWNGDTFLFTISRTDADRPLLTGNRYDLYEGTTKVGTAQVRADGTLQVSITFDEADAAAMDEAEEQNASVTRVLTVKGLPNGSYSVTENEYPRYVQSQRTVTDLVIPGEEAPTVVFTNALIRPTGSLYLEKELVAAEGYHEPLPEDTEFSFLIELTEVPPERVTIQLRNSDLSTATVHMVNGKFAVRLRAGQHVVISGLPIGGYRITEATVPHYANSFSHRIGGAWVPQPVTSTPDGQMYTDIAVLADAQSEVLCTNTYPVNRTELIIQKLVTKEYDRDTLPGGSFTFTVTLAETDLDSYAYTVWNASGTEIRSGTVTVTDKRLSLSLEAGQYVVIEHMPVCGYTVEETVSGDYRPSYQVYQSQTDEDAPQTEQLIASGDGAIVSRTFVAGKTEKVVFTNEYKKHLGQLTITKTVNGNADAGDTFLFHIYKGEGESKQKLMDVTIQGQGSVTVYDLPFGTYTVVEDDAWSWRYTTADASKTAELTMDTLAAEVGFANTYHDNQWLNYFSNLLNEFLAPVPKGDDE